MLHVRPAGDDAGAVPLAGSLEVPGRRGVQRISGPGAGEPGLVVFAADVVEQLIFRRRPVDVALLLGAAIEDAAVAGVADLPVHLELEVAELVPRDDVRDLPVLGERA